MGLVRALGATARTAAPATLVAATIHLDRLPLCRPRTRGMLSRAGRAVKRGPGAKDRALTRRAPMSECCASCPCAFPWGGGMSTFFTLNGNNNPVNAVAIVQNVAGQGGGGGSAGTVGTGATPGVAHGGDGGPGGNTGGAHINDTLTSITGSTVGENRAGDGGAAGNGALAGSAGGDAGILNGSGVLNLTHVTVAGNTLGAGASNTAGGVAERFAGDVRVYNTLVASNDGDECSPGLTDGTPGFNITFQDDGSCPAGFVRGDPKLGPVKDNTGTTPTMALGAGSAAIDTADAGSCTGTDQRGVARPKGAGCDIGAFERSPPSAATGAATLVGTTAATVAGTGNMGTLPGSHRFQYGKTTAYGKTTPALPEGRGTTTVNPSETLSGLKPNTTYHYRLVVTNADGTAVGVDRTFKTKALPYPGVAIKGKGPIKITKTRCEPQGPAVEGRRHQGVRHRAGQDEDRLDQGHQEVLQEGDQGIRQRQDREREGGRGVARRPRRAGHHREGADQGEAAEEALTR
jgi:hypothetical protein